MTNHLFKHRMMPVALTLLLAVALLWTAGAIQTAFAAGGSWATNGPAGTTVWSMVIDPTNTNNVYAGTSGGVFKSSDGGGSWVTTSITGFSGNPVFLAINPVTPTTLYASREGTLYKSTDGGANWSTITGPAPGFHRAVAVDPSTPTTLYVGIRGGSSVYKSTDSGTTWYSVYPGSSFVADTIVVDPNNPATVYAGGGSPSLYKSTDGGVTWTNAGTGLAGVSVRSVAIDPTNANTLYVGVNGGSGGVFKSNDGGATWSASNNGLSPTDAYPVVLDPNDSNKLYAGTFGGGVFESSDGGASWRAFNSGLTTLNVYSFLIDPSNSEKLYAGTAGGGVFILFPNSSPVAVDDTAVTNANTPVDIDVLANDSDPENDALGISAVGSASNGTAAISGSQVAYTPTLDFAGTDTFTYTVSDGSLTDSAIVTVTVRSTFALIGRGPAANTVGVAPSANISATFDAEVDAATVTTQTFTVQSNIRGLFPYTPTVSGSSLTVDPADFWTGEQVQVVSTSGVQGTEGQVLTPTQWGFTTGPVTNRCVAGFTDIGASLTNLSGGNAAWADYDLDGDLDFIVNGVSTGTRVTQLYRNDGGGSFTPVNTGLPNIDGLGIAWGDYDNDGDLDILLSGYIPATNGFISDVYRNDGGGVFTPISAVPVNNTSGSSAVAWGDYDNDGDLDFVLSGNRYGDRPADVYRNDGNDTFTPLGTGINGASQGDAAWGDYDNDGDLDFLLSGYLASGAATQLYRNDGGGSFTAVNTSLPAAGTVDWGDYNNDGLLDIVLIGLSNNYTGGGLYRNDENDTFTAISSPLAGLYSGDATFGDYDNDGDLDIAVIGTPGSGFVSDVFRNDGNDTFVGANTTIIDVWAGSLGWGDYDNDGDLDLLLTGGSAQNTFHTKVYRNDDCVAEPFNLTSHGPANKAVGVAPSANITATFDADLNASTVTTQTFIVRSDLRGSFSYTATVDGNMLTLDPSDYLTGEQVKVFATGGIRSTDGNTLEPKSWSFTAGLVKDRCVAKTGFVDINTNLQQTQFSGAVWGDYDGDGDLDVLLSGDGLNTTVFRNDGSGNFVDIAAGLPELKWGSAEWGDYDNDGDLDILVTGTTGAVNGNGPGVTILYRNDGGTFVDSGATLNGIWRGEATFGDYDNDGDLDILLAGQGSSAVIYRNDSGVYTDSGADLPAFNYASVEWGDYDGDGDLDFFISGNSSGAKVSAIYRNDGGAFSDIGAGLTGVQRGDADWGDYDNDGDLDLVIAGETQDSGVAQIAQIYNNNSGVFTNISAGLTGIHNSTVAWGDYDNDGDLDLVYSGASGVITRASGIYRNDGGGTFTPINSGLAALNYADAMWGDYDNDGDLDVLLTGFLPGPGPYTRIYRNDDCPPITDGNGDGIPDDQQANVETLISGTGNYVTLAAPTGITLQNVQKVQPPAALPQNVTLPQGLLSFDATGVSAGGSFTMTVIVQTGPIATSYWKYGPEPGNTADHWYEFLYDEATGTGAKISGRTITLYFVDGKRGDSDLTANGTIVDPGAPAGTVLGESIYLPLLMR